ncbi:restriction endonuclease [Candidatus Bathyarchaeota archaeon ex4484_205]|nr:MAG: restriction endonuclease [Candidatus Bathyarchaeota archaeon ex4484_205]
MDTKRHQSAEFQRIGRLLDIATDGRVILDSYIRVPIPDNIDRYLLKPGDILFNNTNSVDLIGKTAIFRGECDFCTYSNHITRIKVDESKVAPEWVLYNFIKKWQGRYFRQVCVRHVGQAGIRSEDLMKTLIPLPPLPEQRKIAEILSTVDEAIQKVDEAIKKTERLKKGLMQELLTKGIGHTEFKDTEIGRIPKEWKVVRLRDVCLSFIGGGTPSTTNPDYWNGDIAWMTSAHIKGRVITTGQKFITKEGLRNSTSNLIPKDNLLVATRVGIGKAAINKIDIAISQDLTGIIIDKNKSAPDFLYWCIINNERRLKSLAQGSTIKGILREELGRLKIPLPPLSEQQKIAEILSTVDKKLELERKRKEKLERIKKGLMNDLLTGRERVKV